MNKSEKALAKIGLSYFDMSNKGVWDMIVKEMEAQRKASFSDGIQGAIKSMEAVILTDKDKDQYLAHKIGPVAEREKLIASILFKHQRDLMEKVIKELK